MKPVYFVDFEASGIAPDSYPIEIAIVSADSKYQALIKPAYYWQHWSYDAQDMHGISREDLLTGGRDAFDLADDLNTRFAGASVCSDSNLDCFWLDTLYEAAGIEPTFTVSPLGMFMPEDDVAGVCKLMSPRKVHRALPDALDLMNAAMAYFSSIK